VQQLPAPPPLLLLLTLLPDATAEPPQPLQSVCASSTQM
jgi:hypothetical protein